MKILMIAPTPFFSDRGCHVRIFEETKILQKLGHKVTVFTYHLGKNLENIDIRRIKNVNWYKKTSAGPSYKKLYLDFLLLLKILKETKKEKYDLIHGSLHEGAFLSMIIKKFRKIPFVFDYQGSLVKEMEDHGYLKNKLMKKIFQKMENSILKSSQVIITSSTKSKEELEKAGIKKAVALLDGVDTEQFYKKDTKKLKKELGLENKRLIVYLGVLSKYQGVDLLLETIPLVTKEIPGAHFIIAGYPNIEYYKKKANDLNILKNITFTGQIDYKKAPEYISLGDIAISLKLSKTEANGKLYNYMACGIPSIATDNEINKEILQETGIYCSPDKKEVAEKILALLKNENLRKKIGDLSRKKALESHSWEARGEQLLKIYEKCLNYH